MSHLTNSDRRASEHARYRLDRPPDVENDNSIVTFTTNSSGSSPALGGFTDTGSLESWSKPLAAPNDGLVTAATDGGVVASSIDTGYSTVRLARFTGSSTGGSGGSGTAAFTDVPAGAFYRDAVAWLKDQGITTGASATTNSPTMSSPGPRWRRSSSAWRPIQPGTTPAIERQGGGHDEAEPAWPRLRRGKNAGPMACALQRSG